MSRTQCICALLYAIYHIWGSKAITITLDYQGTGLLKENDTELVCSFSGILVDNVVAIYLLKKNVTNSFTAIAHFRPNGYANLTNMTDSLNGRVELINAIKLSSQITLRITFLLCEDENEYICRMGYLDSNDIQSLDSNTKKIIVKASPLQPDISQLNSTLQLEEGQDVSFKCDGNVGKPPGKYIWQKIRKNDSNLITYDNVTTVTTVAPHSCTYNGTSGLTFQCTAEDNQAIVRCADQSMPSLYKDSQPINVLYKIRPPTISKHPHQTYYLVRSGDIELKCHGDGNPQSSYTWYKDDNKNQTLSFKASLVIDSENTTNNGTYVCNAFNSFNGKIYDQFQSVDILLVYEIPTSTSSTLVIKAEDTAVYQQPWFWIIIILIVVIILLSIAVVHLVRARVSKPKNATAYCDIKEQTSENNRYDIITSSQFTLNNDGYEDMGILNPIHPIHGVNTG